LPPVADLFKETVLFKLITME